MMTCLPGFVGVPRGVNGLRLPASLLEENPEETVGFQAQTYFLQHFQLAAQLAAFDRCCLLCLASKRLTGWHVLSCQSCIGAAATLYVMYST